MLTHDPLNEGGLIEFAKRFRKGEVTSEQTTKAYLDRIDALNPTLQAFEYVANDQAITAAQAIDALFAAGADLGPLMGVPVAVKDLLTVDGMPTYAGTRLDIADLIGPEGPVIRSLRRAGCVILGKTKTVEFALGITGVSAPRGTPRNPWDAEIARLPGGSSSGSAVAVSAGLCAFALGSDTGGSVRVPAAMNGIFGLKVSYGRFSNEGCVPLAPHIDTIGLLTRSARDAALVFSVLTESPMPEAAKLERLTFGRPESYFFEDLDPEISERVEAAMGKLADTGSRVLPFSLPEAPDREQYFPVVLPVCLLSQLGTERFLKGRDLMDPVIARRVAAALDARAVDYLALETRRAASQKTALKRFDGFDAWISPTATVYPLPIDDLADEQTGMKFALGMTRNTQPANYLDLCAVSLPLSMQGYTLPAGLQLMGRPGREEDLLAIALAVEQCLGQPSQPRLASFLR